MEWRVLARESLRDSTRVLERESEGLSYNVRKIGSFEVFSSGRQLNKQEGSMKDWRG